MAFEEYLSAGVHIGMKQVVKDMKKFVYKVRPDGLAVLNVSLIDERLDTAAKFLTKFDNIVVASRKNVGQKSALKFAEAVGAKSFIGRFLPGTITNPSFPGYSEADVIVITDPVVDKQAVTEAVKMRIPVIGMCDTFNETKNIDLVIPCNNKGKKSIATIYWALAKKLLLARGDIKSEDEFKLTPADFESQ